MNNKNDLLDWKYSLFFTVGMLVGTIITIIGYELGIISL